jgi:hypothetical protein
LSRSSSKKFTKEEKNGIEKERKKERKKERNGIGIIYFEWLMVC